MTQATLSTHVLDLENGQPAAGLSISLRDEAGATIATAMTDDDGRVGDFPSLSSGIYALTFAVETWFAELNRDCFYPEVTVTFKVADTRPHYHVPLLLNRYGYSTYRGS